MNGARIEVALFDILPASELFPNRIVTFDQTDDKREEGELAATAS